MIAIKNIYIMKCVLITPTHQVNPDGYFEAKIQEADFTSTGIRLVDKPWYSDNIHFHGELQMDFENRGNIVVWNRNNRIFVRQSYTTDIYGGEEAINYYANHR